MSDPAAPRPSSHPAHQAALGLLRVVQALHRSGYQRVRFSSGMAPSGVHWRCAITHAGNMSDDGLRIIDHASRGDVASYSTGSLDRYFGWSDAPGRTAEELAALFEERFPRIVQQGSGRDEAYAGWLREAIGRAERGGPSSLPVFFADYPLRHDPASLPPAVRTRPRWRTIWDTLRGEPKG